MTWAVVVVAMGGFVGVDGVDEDDECPLVSVPAIYPSREEAEAAAAARDYGKGRLLPPRHAVFVAVEVGGLPVDASEKV